MAPVDGTDTRDRLLDTAERLFGERGLDAVSLREITRDARANVAAVNYHFGTKEGLLKAVFDRRFVPLNEERLRLLDLAESAAGDSAPTLESILSAFIAPTFRFFRSGPGFMKLVGRLHHESDEACMHMVADSPRFLELVERLRRLLIRALPGAEVGELWWGMHFLLGAMIHTWTGSEQMEQLSRGEATYGGDDAMIERLVRFAAAGLRSTSVTKEREAAR